jgi:hypothetical protein
MGMQGSLGTMSVLELLRWASSSAKSGTLEIEHGRIVKRLELRDGEIVGCSSDDPSSLLGQYLLSRGKINEDILRSALRAQELTGTNLGQVFVEMGVLSAHEVDQFVSAKAEESLLGLFDVKDGVFRFEKTAGADPTMMGVKLKITELLERGEQLHAELDRIRAVLKTGTVLGRSNRPPADDTLTHTVAQRIYDAVDGKRTIAEVLLHVRTSEFVALKFLYKLYSQGALKIRDAQIVTSDGGTPEAAMQLARQLVAQGDYEAALDALESAYRLHRTDEALRRMIPKVEAVFVEMTYRRDVAPKQVPVLVLPKESLLQEDLSPAEFFLISTIENGNLDVKSITWVAPMREVEVLRMMKRLLARGVIELRDPAGNEEQAEAGIPPVTPSVN